MTLVITNCDDAKSMLEIAFGKTYGHQAIETSVVNKRGSAK